ncbi:tape measure protein [Devosia sp. MC1541]|uniref:tape measure protein n=1 Tax=Devosia sp. MC1541 TaxID=2725264 RepID=UPI00145DEF1A|nr:tape measure protein [Devosia sp. MC1541]
MTDIAELGLVVRSDGVVVASQRLKDLEGQAGHTEKAMALLGRAAAAAMAAFSVGKLIEYADAWSDMQSRVGAAIKSMDAAPAMMQRIVDIANASYSPLAQTAEIYARNVGVLRDLGLGSKEAADYTESLNHMLVITATRGERATSVQNALSKAMAMGKLTGEGLESVLANGGRVAEALAKELDTNVNGLRKLASEGKITSGVISNALLKSLEDVRVEAGEMSATVSDAWVIMNNNVTAAIGTFDKAYGVSGKLAEGIIFLANNLDMVVAGAAGLAAAIGVVFAPAVVAATGAMWAFTASLLANPLTAVAVVVALVVARIVTLIQEVGGLGNAFQHVQMTAMDVWERIKAGGQSLADVMQGIALAIQGSFIRAWAAIAEGFANLIGSLGGAAGMLGLDASGAAAYAKSLHTAAASYEAGSSIAFNNAGRNWSKATGPSAQRDIIGQGTNWKEFNGMFNAGNDNGLGGGAIGAAGIGGGGGGKRDAYGDLIRGAREFIDAKNLEIQTLGMATEAAARMRHEQELLNKAANDNIALSPTMRAEIAGIAQEMAATEERARSLTETYNFGKGIFQGVFSDLRQGLKEGKSLWESLGNAALNALDKIAEKAMNMAAEGIWNMIFGAFTGGGMGGGGGGILGGIGKLFSFDGGGHTGSGPRSGGMDGKGGFLAMLHPQETVVDHTKPANSNTAPQKSVVELKLSPELVAQILNEAAGQSVKISQGMVEPVSKAVDHMANQQRYA